MKGWYGNRYNHSMASRGIRSRNNLIKVNRKLILLCDDKNVECDRLLDFLKGYNFKPTRFIHVAPANKLIKYYDGDEEVEYDFTYHEDEPEYPYIAKRKDYDTDEPIILVASDLNNYDTDQIILSILHEHGHTLFSYKGEEYIENWAYNEYRKWDDARLVRI